MKKFLLIMLALMLPLCAMAQTVDLSEDDIMMDSEEYLRIEPAREVPLTGDGANVALWVGLMLVTGAGLFYALRMRRV